LTRILTVFMSTGSWSGVIRFVLSCTILASLTGSLRSSKVDPTRSSIFALCPTPLLSGAGDSINMKRMKQVLNAGGF
jgi:hypothetical protein